MTSCDDLLFKVSANLMQSGQVNDHNIKGVISTLDSFKISASLFKLIGNDNLLRRCNLSSDPSAITLYFKDTSLIQQVIFEVSSAFRVMPSSVKLLIDNLRDVKNESEYTIGSLYRKAFIKDGQHIGITRYGVTVIADAEIELIEEQKNRCREICKANLLLKSSTSLGSNSILNQQYLHEMSNIRLSDGTTSDMSLDMVKNLAPASFGIVNNVSVNDTTKYEGINILVKNGTNNLVSGISDLHKIRTEAFNGLLNFFNGVIALQPLNVMVGLLITDEELTQLNPNKSLYEQDWLVSVADHFKDVSYTDNVLLNHMVSNNKLVYKWTGLRQSVNQNVRLEQVKEYLVKRDYKISYVDLDHFDKFHSVHKLECVSILTGNTYTLEKYRGVGSVLKNIWKRGVGFCNKFPEVVEIGLKGLGMFGKLINDKYHVMPDKIVDFITDGPSVLADVSKDKDWVLNAQQIAMNVLPVVASYIDTMETTSFDVNRQQTLFDDFITRDINFFSGKNQASNLKQKSKFKVVRH